MSQPSIKNSEAADDSTTDKAVISTGQRIVCEPMIESQAHGR